MMHTITAHRLSIQFDSPTPADRRLLELILEKFSDTLKLQYPDAQPQIRIDEDEFQWEEDIVSEAGGRMKEPKKGNQ